MTPPAYQLLVCDLDGTLLRDLTHISSRVLGAVAAARARGVRVTLATGRTFQSTLPFAQRLGIDQPLICYQGGLVRDAATGTTYLTVALDAGLIEQAIRLSRERGWELALYTDQAVLLSEYRRPVDAYYRLLGPTVRLLADRDLPLDGRVIKLTVMSDDEAASAGVEAQLGRALGDRMEVIRSHPLFVEGVPRGTSKGAAVAWLAGFLGVPRHAVMAIGDQDNDASMLAWAGLGVAMGNSSPQCREAADWIAPTIEEDGAAQAIDRFILRAEDETPH